jgi:hypothetical protein
MTGRQASGVHRKDIAGEQVGRGIGHKIFGPDQLAFAERAAQPAAEVKALHIHLVHARVEQRRQC